MAHTGTGDRVILEQSEARVLLPSYHHNVRQLGEPEAHVWLNKMISKTSKFYGPGFDQRVRGYLRQMEDGEIT